MGSISIIIPIINEYHTLIKRKKRFQSLRDLGCELIFIDGGSCDQSCDWLKNHGYILTHAVCQRAAQMNKGASISHGEYLLFLHADTELPCDFAIEWILKREAQWGFFKVALSPPIFLSKLIASGINLRARLTHVATGDQCLFIQKTLFESVGGYPSIALMEDVELSRTLKRICSPLILSQMVTTSSRRWKKHGVIYTACLMWGLQILYKLGVNPTHLHRIYYGKKL